MKFTKMQGCGNDYVYVNCFSEKVEDPSSLAVKIADRHFGVGGDGLILIEPSDKADAYMHMFNLDGSEGNMCGNGIRCVAKYIYDHGIIPCDRDEAVIDTKSGL
ncbi:MAG: diaminopimelate epimerase, partial [Oribacterium sp.]|nr:diaminopimelate epimerase [Oribacterium sp.]